MVFQQGRRKLGDEAYPKVRRRMLSDRECCWKPFSTSDYSTVTLLARLRG